MSDDDIVDLSDVIEPDDMPLCPLCDNVINDWEPSALLFAHGVKGLAHVICIGGARE